MNKKNNSQKGKKYVSSIKSKKQHIEDSDGSQEDDNDHVSNTVAFQVNSKKNVSASVTPDVATSRTAKSDFDVVITNDLESDIDNSDGKEPSTEDIQEAYQIMYENWIKVCKTNKVLKENVVELTKEKEVLKRTTINYEFLALDRERKIQQINTALINIQKNLKLLNLGSSKLDHILSMGLTSK